MEHLSILQLAKRFEGMLKLFGDFFGDKLCAVLLITNRRAQQLKVSVESLEVFREDVRLGRKLLPAHFSSNSSPYPSPGQVSG